ncbi:chorismate-binding protein [Demequina lignilytica]|uniref:Chorismate-binding protein n=1 Tax=Demequina lignilytica TaxID=3051663 RepID=A0AB35MEB5_9MICO|nr:chorismate-binding protein [Demequina sp. SYSU T0a273]MDN4482096.1 chorismate-binding protein [Demequina sp. SYSU T0a273]
MRWEDDPDRAGSAAFRGVRAWEPVEHADPGRDGARIAAGGFWVVVATFEGRLDAWRMARVERQDDAVPEPAPGRDWAGPPAESWETSLDADAYAAGVEAIRSDIRDGEVYQVNLCRMLSAPLPAPRPGPDAVALAHRLATGNPARFASRIVIPAADDRPGAWVVSASPELYLAVDGRRVSSSPIKGTAAPGEPMLPKDEAENIMITDLIRNDLSHVAEPGSVGVPELLGLHDLPGLVHLQSTVEAELADAFDWTPALWPALLAGTFPPGSVSGAPKSSALRIIAREEPTARGPYCGGIGWIDADRRRAELAVGIRTFVWTSDQGGRLSFGTGAGITWGSDPAAEWEETELKARRLIGLASTATMTP